MLGVQSHVRETSPVSRLSRVPVRLVTGLRASPATTMLTGIVMVPTSGLEVKVTVVLFKVPTARPVALNTAETVAWVEGFTVPVVVGMLNQPVAPAPFSPLKLLPVLVHSKVMLQTHLVFPLAVPQLVPSEQTHTALIQVPMVSISSRLVT